MPTRSKHTIQQQTALAAMLLGGVLTCVADPTSTRVTRSRLVQNSKKSLLAWACTWGFRGNAREPVVYRRAKPNPSERSTILSRY